ncbi:hypothetical protein F4778DRAFT_764622 [Xylariomycetidae sp. FL2044]|nr:hypothetical protein F4778DRAFT_764622 [Xylariomycetidae sp. FL2044]
MVEPPMEPFPHLSSYLLSIVAQQRQQQALASTTTTTTTTIMSSTFPQFPRLPPELRHMIWEEYLLDDSQRGGQRLVVEQTQLGAVLPTPSLVSPLLRVSYESRSRALAFFKLVLPVRRVHNPRTTAWCVLFPALPLPHHHHHHDGVGGIGHPGPGRRREDGEGGLLAMTIRRETGERTTTGVGVGGGGKLYLSPEHDRIIPLTLVDYLGGQEYPPFCWTLGLCFRSDGYHSR